MTHTKNNTLYLPIKQIYFDQIIAGTKKAEYREVKEGITASRYLQKDANSKYLLNPEVTKLCKEYYINDYNNGNFPFVTKDYKYLYLAVGYAKERDTAIVEVTGMSFETYEIWSKIYASWVIVYHLGKIIEVYRKPR